MMVRGTSSPGKKKQRKGEEPGMRLPRVCVGGGVGGSLQTPWPAECWSRGMLVQGGQEENLVQWDSIADIDSNLQSLTQSYLFQECLSTAQFVPSNKPQKTRQHSIYFIGS